MKKAAFLLAMVLALSFTFSTQKTEAQNPFKGFFKPLSADLVTGVQANPLKSGTWLARMDVGIGVPAFGFNTDEEGKITGIGEASFPKTFSGLLFTHIKTDGTKDWGTGLGLTIPTVEGDVFGVALFGAYNVFLVGINYDFGMPPAKGIKIFAGMNFDLFNLIE